MRMRFLLLLSSTGLMCPVKVSSFAPCNHIIHESRLFHIITERQHHRHQQPRRPFLHAASATPAESSPLSSESSSSSSTADDLPANLRRKVSAKRPLLGNVVPKASRITQAKQQQQPSASGGSSQPELRLQGREGGNRRRMSQPLSSSTKTNSATSSSSNPTSLLRIMGGSQKGRRLDSPQLVYLRPMMSKVKEAVYSTLISLGLYETNGAAMSSSSSSSCRHLDLFAGSGSVGLESLSRGATHCTFCDLAEDCCQTIQRNLDKCQFDDNDNDNDQDRRNVKPTTYTIVRADVLDLLRQPAAYDLIEPYSLVTICPPYEEVIYGDLLEATVNSPLVTDDTVVVVEYPTELKTLPHVISSTSSSITAPKKLIGVRNRRYGRTVIAIYICNPSGRLEGAASRPEEFVVQKK